MLYKKLQGFILIEVVIALCIIGVLSSIMLPFVKTMLSYSKITQTHRSFENVLRSLTIYASTHNRLPWPSKSIDDGLEDENSEKIIGFVPYKTLCLEKQMVFDGNKRSLIYIVNPLLTDWRPQSELSDNDFLSIQGESKIKIFYEDGSEAIPSQESSDFCALILISVPSPHTCNSFIQYDKDTLKVTIPSQNSDIKVRWISRNNLVIP